MEKNRNNIKSTGVKLSEYLNYFIYKIGLFHVDFWKEILEVSQPTISMWSNNKTIPSPRRLLLFIDVLFNNKKHIDSDKLESFTELLDEKIDEKSQKKFKKKSTIGDYILIPEIEKLKLSISTLPFKYKHITLTKMISYCDELNILNKSKDSQNLKELLNKLDLLKYQWPVNKITKKEKSKISDITRIIDKSANTKRRKNIIPLLQETRKHFSDIQLIQIAHECNWPNWVILSLPSLFINLGQSQYVMWKKMFDYIPQEKVSIVPKKYIFNNELIIVIVNKQEDLEFINILCNELDERRLEIPFPSVEDIHNTIDCQHSDEILHNIEKQDKFNSYCSAFRKLIAENNTTCNFKGTENG